MSWRCQLKLICTVKRYIAESKDAFIFQHTQHLSQFALSWTVTKKSSNEVYILHILHVNILNVLGFIAL